MTQVAIRVAAISVLVFTWHVFRSKEGWPTAFAVLIAAALGMSWLALPYTRTQAHTGREIFWYDFFALARTLAIAWGSLESLRYHARSRRQMRLGLTDAFVTDRFLLWSIGHSSNAARCVISRTEPQSRHSESPAGMRSFRSGATAAGEVGSRRRPDGDGVALGAHPSE